MRIRGLGAQAGAGMALLLVAVALGGCGSGDAGAPADRPATVGPAALTERPATRPEGRLTMCVQAVRGLEDYQGESMRRLGEAVKAMQEDRRWGRYFPSPEAPVVDSGCPGEPAVPRPAEVDAPGFYRLHVFVVKAVPYDAVFAQEVLRGAGVQASAGVFVTTSDLCDAGKLVALLMAAAGFDHAPVPTDTPAPEGPAGRPVSAATPCL